MSLDRGPVSADAALRNCLRSVVIGAVRALPARGRSAVAPPPFCEPLVDDAVVLDGSTAGRPTKVSRSLIIDDFTRRSIGESHPSDGDRFTSNSHGFKSSSTKISKPYNSENEKTNKQKKFDVMAL